MLGLLYKASRNTANLHDGRLSARNATTTGPPPDFVGTFPVSDETFTLASTYLICTLTVQIVAVIVFFARVYTRSFPWRFTIDDYLISIAFVLMTIMFGLQYSIESFAWGFNRPAYFTLEKIQYDSMLGTISLPFWAWSTGLVKISIACMLLRFQQSQRWRIFLYFMIVLNLLLVGFTGIGNLFQCIPYQATWDFVGKYPNKKCWSKEMAQASMYLSSICNVTTDIIFSLMPLTFLGKIRRPLRERVVIGGLMALGLVASSFSLSRAIITPKVEKSSDPGASMTLIGLLTTLEVQTSLVAACIPTLRSSSRRLLSRLGLTRGDASTAYRRYGAGSSMSGGPKGFRRHRFPPDHIESGGTADSYSEEHVRDEHATSDLGEEDLQMDPTTGRIVCTREVRIETWQYDVDDRWRRAKETESQGSMAIGIAQ